MSYFKDPKKLIGFLCVLGFLTTSSALPMLYFFKNKSNQTIAVSIPEKESTFDKIKIKASAVAIYDTTSGKFIYTKNGSSQLPLASITKVMSGISALRIAEGLDNNKSVKFAGKWWDLIDLMKFALVSSSNSGIANIAEAMSKIEDAKNDSQNNVNFVGEMNNIAKELGLQTMFFLNETGLDQNEHLAGAYGSAEDTSKMFAYAIKKYPNVFEATKYPEIKITSEDGEVKASKNTNIDVSKMTTIMASKTGTTDLAGGNLVIAFDAGISHPIIISVLGSTPEDRFTDVETLAKATVESLSN
ncbi:MAG: hypothetical protein WCO84_00800 [bacterium]